MFFFFYGASSNFISDFRYATGKSGAENERSRKMVTALGAFTNTHILYFFN